MDSYRWTKPGSVDWTKICEVPSTESPEFQRCLQLAAKFEPLGFEIRRIGWTDDAVDVWAFDVADIPAMEARVRRWVKQRNAGDEGARSTKGELVAARTLRAFVAAVSAIPEKKGIRTCDLVATSKASGERIDIEVVTPDWKHNLKDGGQRATKLAQDLASKRGGARLALSVGVVDDAAAQSATDIVTAAGRAAVGSHEEVRMQWFVHGCATAEQAALYRPDWWPNQVAEPVVLTATSQMDLGAPTPAAAAITITSEVAVHYTFSAQPYRDPVVDKAEHGQLDGAHAGLIVVNCSYLPGWRSWAKANLVTEFPRWSNVSAVLGIVEVVKTEHLRVETALFVNPDATHQLPADVREELAANPRLELPFWKD